jgi:uncharacterized damage-inducible protein DinB
MITMDASTFQSAEVAMFWRYIESSLARLVELAASLDDDALRWRPPAEGANSVAVLALHTLGNAEENLIEFLCGEPVNRRRDAEFDDRTVTGADIEGRWRALHEHIVKSLAILSDADLLRRVHHVRRGELVAKEILILVARHAAEHLGQAELTRDLCRAAA